MGTQSSKPCPSVCTDDAAESMARRMGWRKPSELVSGVCCEDASCDSTTDDGMAVCGPSGKKWLQLQTTYAYKGKEPLCPSRGHIVDRNEQIKSCSTDGCAMHMAQSTTTLRVDNISNASDCEGKTANTQGDREWDAESSTCYAKFPIPYVLNSNLTTQKNATGPDDCKDKCMNDNNCIAFQFGPGDKCSLATHLNPDSGTTNKVWRSDTADNPSANSVVGFKSCPPRANLNRLYVNATGSCPEEADVGRFGFNAFNHGIDAAFKTLQTQLQTKQGSKLGEFFQWEQLGNDMGVWYTNKSVGECQSLCERSARCGEFYHDSENEHCMMFDGACHDIDTTNTRRLYGMGTRISGMSGGVCSDGTLQSEDLCWSEGNEWHLNMYSSNLALAVPVNNAAACTLLCENKCDIGSSCRSIYIEDTQSCYCDATDIVLGDHDRTGYDHYVAPHPPTLPHVYQKTIGNGYTINDLASAEAACNAEEDDLGRPLTLCPKEAMFLQNKCTFGYVRNERLPGMVVDDLKTHREEMHDQHINTNSTCESTQLDKSTCENKESGMVNYNTHKCIWGYDDQTGNFACRPAWWNMCGSEPGRWHSADKYNAAAHCCTQNK